MLAIRLKHVISNVILQLHYVFVKGIQILDDILIANEVVVKLGRERSNLLYSKLHFKKATPL